MADKRFTASLNCRHRVTLTNVMGRAPVGGGTVTLTAQEDKDLRDMAGAVNQAAAAPGGCDGAPPEVNTQAQIINGDNSRKLYAESRTIPTAFPFLVPSGPFTGPNGGLMYMSAAEFQGAPLLRMMTISAIAGDLNIPLGSPLRSDGKQPTIFLRIGVDVQPGALLYANLIATEDFIPGQSGSGFSISWPAQ